MIHSIPREIEAAFLQSRTLIAEIRDLKQQRRLTKGDLRRLADLRADLARFCPPHRYAWLDGLPVVDLFVELRQIKEEGNENSIS